MSPIPRRPLPPLPPGPLPAPLDADALKALYEQLSQDAQAVLSFQAQWLASQPPPPPA